MVENRKNVPSYLKIDRQESYLAKTGLFTFQMISNDLHVQATKDFYGSAWTYSISPLKILAIAVTITIKSAQCIFSEKKVI